MTSACGYSTAGIETKKTDIKPTINVYTDSQTIANLPARRGKLEANHFLSGRTKLPLGNGDLYQKFYAFYDRLSLNYLVAVHWTKGHTPASSRSDTQTIFAKVDLAARSALRLANGALRLRDEGI